MAKRSTKTVSRKHVVRGTISNIDLVKAGSALTLEVLAREERLGTLEIGRGAMYWRGANRRSRKRIDWTSFAAMMDELAYG